MENRGEKMDALLKSRIFAGLLLDFSIDLNHRLYVH